MRLVHAADLHLDSPLRGLSEYPGAPEEDIRSAARRAMEGLVELTVREEASALLLAGDIYDGEWRDYNTGLFFTTQMARLRDAGIDVFLIRGNHDAQSRITSTLSLPPNVHPFRTDRPETVRREDLGLAVHGQGFARQDVSENLVEGYPRADPGLFNVGLLHTAIEGSEGHARYAPCTRAQLADQGYDYWALGHIHKGDVVSADPYIVFPGNLQGRHAKETGPKGCVVLDVEDGRLACVERRELDVVRWEVVHADVTGCGDVEEVCAAVRGALDPVREGTGGRLLAARVALIADGASQSFLWRDQDKIAAEVRLLAADLDGVWVEKVTPVAALRAESPRLAGEAVGSLRRAAAELGGDPDALDRAVRAAGLDKHAALLADGDLRLDDHEAVRRLLDEALELLVATVTPGMAEEDV